MCLQKQQQQQIDINIYIQKDERRKICFARKKGKVCMHAKGKSYSLYEMDKVFAKSK